MTNLKGTMFSAAASVRMADADFMFMTLGVVPPKRQVPPAVAKGMSNVFVGSFQSLTVTKP
eukprot:6477884-Prymnesium_polylepis.1